MKYQLFVNSGAEVNSSYNLIAEQQIMQNLDTEDEGITLKRDLTGTEAASVVSR